MARRLIGAVVLLLALSGCGGDPQTDPPPAPSTSPASTTPSAPVMPEAAKENTKAGAIAFVRHYVELINHLQSTGDGNALLAASKPACRSCQAVVRAASSIYGSGGHVEGGAWSISRTSARHPAAAIWIIRVAGQLAPSKIVSAGAISPSPGTGGRADAEFVVTFDRAWKVVQWETR